MVGAGRWQNHASMADALAQLTLSWDALRSLRNVDARLRSARSRHDFLEALVFLATTVDRLHREIHLLEGTARLVEPLTAARVKVTAALDTYRAATDEMPPSSEGLQAVVQQLTDGLSAATKPA
jgi:hypothetical protein